MPIPEMTEDEIVGILKHSQSLNIVVEGIDDCIIYRKIEERIGKVDLLFCSGRKNLLNIYLRRDEYINSKYIFIADKDLYLFSSIPSKYAEIVWTRGYSVENDLFNNSNIVNTIIEENNIENFKNDLVLIQKWFAYELKLAKSGLPFELDTYPSNIIDKGRYKPNFVFLYHEKMPIPQIIKEEPLRSIRGKNLKSLISIYFNNNTVKTHCNEKALLLFALLAHGNDLYTYTIPSIIDKCKEICDF
jgi:hypothetical protein